MNAKMMINNSTYASGSIGFWLALLVAIIMVYGIISSLHDALELPIVQRSTSTGECVAIIPKTAATCDTLPRRYSLEWVE